MPKYSIIVPVYKSEKTIKKCVDSILHQQYSDFELILIDDCSPDNCLTICQDYQIADERVMVIHQEINKGVSAARNAGFDAAKGEYILFVDSDDFVAENYLLTIDKFFGNKDLLVFGHYDYITDSNGILAETKKSSMCCAADNEDESAWYILFMKSFFASPCNKVYLKKLIGDIRFDESCVCYEDYIFNLKYCENISSFSVIEEPLYYYRQIPAINHVSKRQWGERFAISRKVAEATTSFIQLHNNEKDIKKLNAYPYGAFLVEVRAAAFESDRSEISASKKAVHDEYFSKTVLDMRRSGKRIWVLNLLIRLKLFGIAAIWLRKELL